MLDIAYIKCILNIITNQANRFVAAVSPPSPGTPRSRRRPIRGDEATPASQPCGHKGKASTRRPVPPRPMDRLLHRTGWACQAPHATQLLARVTA